MLPSVLHPGISRGPYALVLLPDQPVARIGDIGERLMAVIGGAVIDDDELEIGKGLPKYSVHSATDMDSLVIERKWTLLL